MQTAGAAAGRTLRTGLRGGEGKRIRHLPPGHQFLGARASAAERLKFAIYSPLLIPSEVRMNSGARQVFAGLGVAVAAAALLAGCGKKETPAPGAAAGGDEQRLNLFIWND